MSALSISPLNPSIGAEVLGVDLAADLGDDTVVSQIRDAFLTHHVLVFRNQELDRDQHKAFGRLFGDLHVHPSKKAFGLGGDPEIFMVSTDEKTRHNNGGRWHMDLSCEAIPPLGSMLLLKVAPPTGGDTMFANMHLAYETLSPAIQELLKGLHAHHDGLQDLRWYGLKPTLGNEYPSHTHPVVVAHPETGRPLLFVNEAFTESIVGLSNNESAAILNMLFTHIAKNPAIQCRVHWEPGTLVFWDNRCTQHFAVWDYAPHRRLGERVSLCGTEQPAAAFA